MLVADGNAALALHPEVGNGAEAGAAAKLPPATLFDVLFLPTS
jgi:hypothetical protein